MKVNENLIKITSAYIPIDRELELGTDVTILVHATVVKKEQHDNQDGTYNQIHAVKGVVSECLEGEEPIGKADKKDNRVGRKTY